MPDTTVADHGYTIEHSRAAAFRWWWREKGEPLLYLLGALSVLAYALGGSIAHAAPPSAGEQFADEHAADICLALDARPTVPGVVAVLTSLQSLGLSGRESAVALADSVIYVCPIHELLLRQFIAHYDRGERTI